MGGLGGGKRSGVSYTASSSGHGDGGGVKRPCRGMGMVWGGGRRRMECDSDGLGSWAWLELLGDFVCSVAGSGDRAAAPSSGLPCKDMGFALGGLGIRCG